MMCAMTDLGIPGVGDGTLIASGGSALVYEALSGTGERLAVKVLRGIRGAEVQRRFERELTAAERLAGHPNIIRIHHTGVTASGEPYLVMPLIVGGSLDDELERNGAFPLHQATGDAAMAAEVLDFAHARGVLHRDIKPANLLRADNGSVIVTDFGIARVIDAGITSATIAASTPLYAAPEILAENQASVRSEVYGLGALLYALLAGQPAFSGSENIWATMHRIRTETPANITGVPAPVMRVLHQALAKDPADRPTSALLFRENLRTALTAPETWTPPAPTTELTQDLVEPPPVPAFGRAVPAVGSAPTRDSVTAKILVAATALLLVAGLAWWGTSQLLERNTVSAAPIQPPVDNSLPSPDTGDSIDGADSEPTDEVTIEDLPTPPQIPTTFVSFTGDHFSALLPEGWALAARDIEESYGFRSKFVTDNMYLNIDTTPKEQREPGGDIAQGARDIASGIGTASEVRTEDVDGLTMHSFTFRNDQGVDSIDIFFEVDGDGYAVVAGSASDPDTAFATARLVALSIRSNPS